MSRESYIYDRKLGKVVPKSEYHREHTGLTIIKDIEPYQSVIDKSVIGGRKQHRDHLRAHGCVEVGNDMQRPTKSWDMPAVGADIKRVLGE